MRHVSCSEWRSWQATRPKRLTAVSENRVRVSVVAVGAGVLAVVVAAVGAVEVAAVIVHGVSAVAVVASASVVRAVAFRG